MIRASLALMVPLAVAAAVFPAGVTRADLPRLLAATAWVRSIDDAALLALVPERSGLHFVGCPNCAGGRQEGQLSWSPDRPREVFCRYCRHRYPSGKYPAKEAIAVRNPRGETQHYRYWADANGYRYFFEARRDSLVREYLANAARDLALLYTLTGDGAHARRAALLIGRFAEVFPGWCFHYDYPFQQKVVYDGDVPPEQFRPGYRTARWTWWAYNDVPTPLVQAYDWLSASAALDEEARARIERDLFRNAADQVLANPETNGNMSPTAWSALIRVGRILGEPRYVREPASRLQRFVETRFFYDGVWPEGAPSYHAQTTGNLQRVLDLLGDRFETERAAVARSQAALLKMRLPNGRFVPVHDTWPDDKRAALEKTQPYLLPALGHACLGGGRGGAQAQFHMTWSGGYGHQHADNLSINVFAYGREMLSDLGYTHTRQRAWTLASAAHNTVVIDGRNQATGSATAPSDGSLRWFEVDGDAQAVSAEGLRAYPGVARVYRRTLMVRNAGENRRYAVDVFEVEGGLTHDYLLHGDADHGGPVSAPLAFEPLAALLPLGVAFQPAANEGQASFAARQHWAYGYFRNLRSAAAPEGAPLEVAFRGLRVTLLPESGSTLVLGENPAIRGAGEDDSKLDQFTRPFLMLRREAAGRRSTFVAVIEPYESQPFIRSVERVQSAEGAVKLRIEIDGRTETVEYHPERAFERLALEAVDGQVLRLRGSAKAAPRAGEVVRVVTGDGWVYPYTVSTATPAEAGFTIRVEEGPGFVLESGRLRQTAYPRRQHAGPVQVEWLRRE